MYEFDNEKLTEKNIETDNVNNYIIMCTIFNAKNSSNMADELYYIK